MKYLLFILILISHSLYSIGQTAPDFETGFKDFKLGDSKTKWEKVITPTRTKDYSNYYQYTGNCCDTFFGVKIKYINLMFDYGNRLKKIIIVLNLIGNLDSLNLLKQTLFNKYGKTNTSADNKTGGFDITWTGKESELNIHAFAVNGKYEAGIHYEYTNP